MKFFRDLFMGAGNVGWDLARVSGGWAIFSYSILPIIHIIRNGQLPNYSEVGIGFAAVLAGAGGFIFAKDTARSNAISQVTKDATAADVAGAAPPAKPEGKT